MSGLDEWSQVKALVENAAPYLDAVADDLTKWKPSTLIRIGYHIIASGTKPELAAPYVNDMIEEARNRYAAGFYADPFMEPVKVRAAA